MPGPPPFQAMAALTPASQPDIQPIPPPPLPQPQPLPQGSAPLPYALAPHPPPKPPAPPLHILPPPFASETPLGVWHTLQAVFFLNCISPQTAQNQSPSFSSSFLP